MSILIKGMEMPKACYECCMYEADIYYCAAAERDIDIPSSDEGRCLFCPLVPVPPHGDLIDRTKLIYCGMNEEWTTREVIEKAPTIIPADPAEEGET